MIQNFAIKVVIFNPKGQVLILRESPKHSTNTKAGRWQLPGGRIEPGEPYEQGLCREIYEETKLTNIKLGKPILVGEWWPVIKGHPHQIFGVFLMASTAKARIILSEEHDAYEWIDPSQRVAYDIVDPDWQAIDKASKPL